MKFDDRTLEVLKNYMNINTSMLFDVGNKLSIVSKAKVSTYKLDFEIPSKFIIYDMPRLLNVLMSYSQPNIEVTDSYITISEMDENISKSRKVKYILTSLDLEKSLFPLRIKDIKLPSSGIFFNLNREDLKFINKMIKTLNLSNLVIFGEDGILRIQGMESNNTIQDVFEIELGTTSYTFGASIKKENFILIEDTYDVTVFIKNRGNTTEGMVHFIDSETKRLEYMIALENNSYLKE